MEKYKLVDTFYVCRNEDGSVHISLPSEKNLEIEKENADIFILAMKLFINPSTVNDLSLALEKNLIDLDNVSEFMELLKDLNIIKPYINITEVNSKLTPKQFSKFDRQIKNFSVLENHNLSNAIKLQENLLDSRVLIIGVGGVGSYLSMGLAQVGVGEIHLIDFDEIELSNTSRQVLYREKDVGLKKIDVAVKNLKEISPDSDIISHSMKVESVEQLLNTFGDIKFDLILVAADKPLGKIHRIMGEFSNLKNIPIMFGSPYAQGKVYLGPLLIPGKTADFSKLFPVEFLSEDDNLKEINKASVSAIVDTDNALAAKMMEAEAIKFLGENKSNIIQKQLILDVSNWDVKYINLD